MSLAFEAGHERKDEISVRDDSNPGERFEPKSRGCRGCLPFRADLLKHRQGLVFRSESVVSHPSTFVNPQSKGDSMPSKRLRVLLTFTRGDDHLVEQLGGSVILNLFGNKFFPAPPVDQATVQ